MITTAISAFVLSATLKAPALNFAPMSDLEGGQNFVKKIKVIDGKLYVAGNFERANRKLVNNIAVWDGTAWSGLGKGVDGTVKDFIKYKNDIYVCGDFSYVNKGKNDEGMEAYHIAKWDGTKWSALAPRPVDRDINALATDGTTLFIGGNFTKINDETETRGVAKYDGKKITAMGGQFDRAIMSMVWSNGKLYAGGIFNEFGDDSCRGAAVWDGKAWSELGGGLQNSCYAVATDGKNVFFSENTTGVKMWDGSKFSVVVKSSGEISSVNCDGGKLFVAGDFNEVNGVKSHNLAILEGGKVVNTIPELLYSHHYVVFPYAGKYIIGGAYGDVQGNKPGGVLAWDGAKSAVGLLPSGGK
jgi:hypothetical protein